MTKRPMMTQVDGGRPPAPRWGIVLQSVIILIYITSIVLVWSDTTFRWYAWLLAVSVVLQAYAVINDVLRAGQTGRRW